VISPGDILTAKLIVQLGLVSAERVRQVLQAADGDADHTDLITRLVLRRLLNDSQASEVRRLAALFDRVRHDGTMIKRLERSGALSPGQLTEVLALLEAGDYRQQLRECLVYLGIVDAETAQRATWETLEAVRAKDQSVLERYRGDGFQGVSRPLIPHDTIDATTLRVSVLFRSQNTRRLVRKAIQQVRMATAERPAAYLSESFLDIPADVVEPAAPPVEDPEATREIELPAAGSEGLDQREAIGDYVVVECIGRGGMGAVFLAQEEGVGAMVAVKTLLAQQADASEVARFEREAAICAELKHPNVVQLYDQGTTEDGVRFMVIPIYTGRSLKEWLEKEGGRLPLAQAFDVFEQALEGMQHIHEHGVVHRDLKPENLFVVAGTKQIKVIDLGIARRLDDERSPEERAFRTASGKIMGSPAYIAPESIAGDAIDGRTDLYSMGVMLFQLLTGKLPLTAETPYEYLREHMVGVPLTLAQARRDEYWCPELERLVARLLAKERDDRPASCAEVLELLRGGLRDQAIAQHASPPPEPEEEKGFFSTFFKRSRGKG
jgi:predicted Ser/Thr protein kinase